MAHLHTDYQNRIKSALMEEFDYDSIMEVPKLDKVVINMGVGEASLDRKKIDGALADLTRISGQKPVITRAKKSIAACRRTEKSSVVSMFSITTRALTL